VNQIGEKRRPEEENPTPTEEEERSGSTIKPFNRTSMDGWPIHFFNFFLVLFYSDCCMSVVCISIESRRIAGALPRKSPMI
jgi:hypothetical protein